MQNYNRNTEILNHHSKAETISKLTVNLQLFQNYHSPAILFIMYITKLGHGVRS